MIGIEWRESKIKSFKGKMLNFICICARASSERIHLTIDDVGKYARKFTANLEQYRPTLVKYFAEILRFS